ncbi:hypothetical protein ACFX12_039996 [Malus domestica]
MVYEYVLAGVLVSLLSSVFFFIINTTFSEKKKDDVANVSATGVFLAPETEKSTDVVIVGAGVAGAALAYTLGKEGRRVHVIERDLNEPDRIVGELLQPGGYLKLIELGLEDCANESIDAQKVFGYALYKNGNDTKLSYPLETYSSDIAGRSFYNGRFIQRMRERAATLPKYVNSILLWNMIRR